MTSESAAAKELRAQHYRHQAEELEVMVSRVMDHRAINCMTAAALDLREAATLLTSRSAEQDAARYRWLRLEPDNEWLNVQAYPAGYYGSKYMRLDLAWLAEPWIKYTPEALDAAIDAAMKKGAP